MRIPTPLPASCWCISLLPAVLLLVPTIQAQEASSLTDIVEPAPTDPSLFSTYQSTITRDQTSSPDSVGYTTTSNDSVLIIGASSTTLLPANETTLSGNVTATSVESAALPTNTRPCNGYPEFCERQYSNITEVAAHNSPFVRTGSLASNQGLDVTVQLNDGIRMLQFQTHYRNGTVHLCHSSCSLFDAGSLEDYLTTVARWLNDNPYDVITILIGNANLIDVGNYTAPIEASGLLKYAYEPPKIPMALDDWPSLSGLIISGRRAVIFMDYEADQTKVPYILDQFGHMWETPFSPTDRAFPCVVERPPGLAPEAARDSRLYVANHNLNIVVSLLGSSLLVPNTVLLNETNAVSGYGSAGAMAGNCTRDWGRPPNFLLVDYYNIGNFNGSVFEVAAQMNNVTYNGQCCGRKTSGTSGHSSSTTVAFLSIVLTALITFICEHLIP